MKKLSRRIFLEVSCMSICTTAIARSIPSIFRNTTSRTDKYDGKKLNVALCGLGNYAGMLAMGLEMSQYCRLSGIITGHPAKAAEWQNKFNLPKKNIYNYVDFDNIKNNKDIDLVYVVLPNAMHKEFVIRAAQVGKHVITEKPMATSVKDCEEMIQVCKGAGVQLAVGYRLHYEPTHLEIKRLGQDKVFGKVRYIEAGLGYKTYDTGIETSANFNINDPSEWRLKKSKSGGGPLLDLGIYCIQASSYVLGEEPFSVTAQFGTVNNKSRFSEVEESISWQMEFPGGAVSNCISSYGFNIDRLYASADEGFFELSPALSYGPFKGRSSIGELNLHAINQQATQLDEIGKLILMDQQLPKHITGEEGLKDVRIIYSIYEAANTGKKVMLS